LKLSLEDLKLILTGKVDSRTKGSAGNPVETHPTLPMQRVYCIMCGAPHGYVTMESYEYIAANNIIVVCDACDVSMGTLPLEKADIATIPVK
jgi:hypothetical protein